MSVYGLFNIVANDGKADHLIMATELLKQRIKDLTCARQKQNMEDITPTLKDIEQTHIIFVNSHFKPFAAMAFEYNKIRPYTGNTVLGGQVQFSIPQYGDFFADTVLHMTLSSVAGPANVAPADITPTLTGSGTATYTITTYRYVNAAGTTVTGSSAIVDFIRYCDYPGCKILKKTNFTVNGNPLDEYTADVYSFYQKFFVDDDNYGWKRCVGQEVPQDAWGYLSSVSGVGGATDTCRKLTQIVNGAQTPKTTQPALDLWIPLLFWFNLDSRLAVPSIAIPYGQRYITFDLETTTNLMSTAPGGLFLETTVIVMTLTGVDTAPILSSNTTITKTPVAGANSVTLTTPTISTVELYMNNIFVIPEIHDIYIKRIGFSLIRVHRQQSNTVNTAEADTLLQNLKWPIEYMFVGLRPTTNANDMELWHRFTYTTTGTTNMSSVLSVPALNTDITTAYPKHRAQCSGETVSYKLNTNTIDRITMTLQGIVVFDQVPSRFFNSYIPHTFGGRMAAIKTCKDEGALFINFSLYPGTYQPSGHINVSRAREFYLKYYSNIIPATVATADLIVVAKAINFLLITDGSAVLRYTT